jgi:NTE family protein
MGNQRTAFVLAGGGSLGAVQVGMLKALTRLSVVPDFVVGASVGAINGAYFAMEPNEQGVARLERVWLRLRRANVFPFSAASGILAIFGRRDHLVTPALLRALIESELPRQKLEEAQIPCYVVATDVLTGGEIALASGPAVTALLASAAIPAVFPVVSIDGRHLMDGGVANNTPISTAVDLGATRVVVLPTGMSCGLVGPPRGAVALALHALNLLIMRQLLKDIERFAHRTELVVLPPLCPLTTNTYDFSQTHELIHRAEAATRLWLKKNGLQGGGAPHELQPHHHDQDLGPGRVRENPTR